ncbi:MAG: hypothetical protein AAGA54_04105 [Myxococcota bacterium]
MRRTLMVMVLALAGCDDGGGDDPAGTTGTEATTGQGTTTIGPSETTMPQPGTTDAATTDAPGSSSEGSASSSSDGDSTGDASSEGSESGDSSSGGRDSVVGFVDIQVDLENMGGAQGAYPSCIDGPACHNNPERNVFLVADPTPEQLMANYQAILDAPGTPWVTPMDDTAQMLNEVPIPDDVRARWLAWIQAGAPFD